MTHLNLVWLLTLTAAAPGPPQPEQPRSYVCYKTTEPITVDGHLTEPSWQKARWTDLFVDIEGPRKPAPRLQTRVKLLWDDSYLYVATELEEPDVSATLADRDAVIFQDNDFE